MREMKCTNKSWIRLQEILNFLFSFLHPALGGITFFVVLVRLLTSGKDSHVALSRPSCVTGGAPSSGTALAALIASALPMQWWCVPFSESIAQLSTWQFDVIGHGVPFCEKVVVWALLGAASG